MKHASTSSALAARRLLALLFSVLLPLAAWAADSSVNAFSGGTIPFDTRPESTNGDNRQVVVIGDPSTNAGVAPVSSTNGVSVTLTTAIPAGTNAIGSVTLVPATSGGTTPFKLISAASTNATSVKGSAGQLYGMYLSNIN